MTTVASEVVSDLLHALLRLNYALISSAIYAPSSLLCVNNPCFCAWSWPSGWYIGLRLVHWAPGFVSSMRNQVIFHDAHTSLL